MTSTSSLTGSKLG